MTTRQQHTAEPWHVDEENTARIIYASDGWAIADLISSQMLTEQTAKANARRIVACVNACAGIPSDLLEAFRTGGALKVLATNLEIARERDELAEALRLLRRGRHTHVALQSDADTCARCGQNYRSGVHFRAGESNATDEAIADAALAKLKD